MGSSRVVSARRAIPRLRPRLNSNEAPSGDHASARHPPGRAWISPDEGSSRNPSVRPGGSGRLFSATSPVRLQL